MIHALMLMSGVALAPVAPAGPIERARPIAARLRIAPAFEPDRPERLMTLDLSDISEGAQLRLRLVKMKMKLKVPF